MILLLLYMYSIGEMPTRIVALLFSHYSRKIKLVVTGRAPATLEQRNIVILDHDDLFITRKRKRRRFGMSRGLYVEAEKPFDNFQNFCQRTSSVFIWFSKHRFKRRRFKMSRG